MKIGFIGAGKVGFSLGKYFSVNKLNITGYYSRNYASAFAAGAFTESKAYENLEDVVKENDAVFITTPDDEIKNVWQNIKKFNLKGKLIVHTSGSLSSHIFSDIKSKGAFGYSIHPMFPFSDKYNSYKKLNSIYFTLEGEEAKLEVLKLMLLKMGNHVITIDYTKKALYHLANVMVSNMVLSIISFGEEYLVKCGIEGEKAIEALYPLIISNVKNIGESGILSSLTGPVSRGDVGTIKKHLEVIPEEQEEIYKALSRRLLDLSVKGNKSKNYDEIRRLLNENHF